MMIFTETMPASLVFEEVGGRPLCYKGFKQVLENKKSIDDITGRGFIQALMVSIVGAYIKNLPKRRGV